MSVWVRIRVRVWLGLGLGFGYVRIRVKVGVSLGFGLGLSLDFQVNVIFGPFLFSVGPLLTFRSFSVVYIELYFSVLFGPL